MLLSVTYQCGVSLHTKWVIVIVNCHTTYTSPFGCGQCKCIPISCSFFFDNPISFIHATTNTPYLWKPQDILHTFCPSFGMVGTLESSQVTCMMMIFVCHVESCQLGYFQTIHSSKELSVYKTSASPTDCVQKQLDLIHTLPWSWRYGAIINRLKFFQNRPYTPPFFWLQDCTLILPHSFALLVRLQAGGMMGRSAVGTLAISAKVNLYWTVTKLSAFLRTRNFHSPTHAKY